MNTEEEAGSSETAVTEAAPATDGYLRRLSNLVFTPPVVNEPAAATEPSTATEEPTAAENETANAASEAATDAAAPDGYLRRLSNLVFAAPAPADAATEAEEPSPENAGPKPEDVAEQPATEAKSEGEATSESAAESMAPGYMKRLSNLLFAPAAPTPTSLLPGAAERPGSIGQGQTVLTAGPEVDDLGFTFGSRPPFPLVVKEVVSGSWAERQGIKVGDVFVKVNKHTCDKISSRKLEMALRKRPVSLQLLMLANPTLEAGIYRYHLLPEDSGPLGISITTTFRPRIVEVKPDLLAAKKGMLRDYEVHAVNGTLLEEQNCQELMSSLSSRPASLDLRLAGWQPKEALSKTLDQCLEKAKSASANAEDLKDLATAVRQGWRAGMGQGTLVPAEMVLAERKRALTRPLAKETSPGIAVKAAEGCEASPPTAVGSEPETSVGSEAALISEESAQDASDPPSNPSQEVATCEAPSTEVPDAKEAASEQAPPLLPQDAPACPQDSQAEDPGTNGPTKVETPEASEQAAAETADAALPAEAAAVEEKEDEAQAAATGEAGENLDASGATESAMVPSPAPAESEVPADVAQTDSALDQVEGEEKGAADEAAEPSATEGEKVLDVEPLELEKEATVAPAADEGAPPESMFRRLSGALGLTPPSSPEKEAPAQNVE